MIEMRDKSSSRQIVWGIAVSALLHLLLFVLLLNVEPPPAKVEQEAKQAVRLRVLERAQEAKEKAEAEQAKKARQEVADGQIVDIPKPAVEEVPEHARFLSKYDTKVKKEQRSRHRGRPAASPGKPGAPGDRARPGAKVAPGDEGTDGDAVAGAGKKAGEGKLPDAQETVLKGEKAAAGKIDMAALGRLMVPSLGAGGGFAGRMGRGDGGSYGTAGPSGSDDALLGVTDEGETTMVNSRSFRYWDFFQRVKNGVRGTWSPGDLYASRDPTGEVYGKKDRLTVVAVELDAKGAISRLEIVRQSGLSFLDDEALRAFREAGPFLNPPAGLADESGRIKFNFGFLLEVGASRGRFFWQRP
jgi:TonB family protein